MHQNQHSASETADLADLKEGLAFLWRKLEATHVTTEDSAKQTQEKLDLWLKTNYTLLESNQRLIEALLRHSQETTRSIRFCEQGFAQLHNLNSQLAHIETLTIELQHASPLSLTPSLSPERIPLKQIQALLNSVASLRQTLDPLKPTLNQLQTSLKTLHNQTQRQVRNGNLSTLIRSMTLGICLFLVIAILWMAIDLKFLKQQVNQTLWKLQAIEKVLKS